MNPKASETLNQVALPVVPYDTCKRMDYWWFQVKTSMICCGYTLPDELKSVCQVKQATEAEIKGHSVKNVLHFGFVTLTGRLWGSTGLPGHTWWSLGGSWYHQLRSYWMHNEQKALRVHPLLSLPSLDLKCHPQGALQ